MEELEFTRNTYTSVSVWVCGVCLFICSRIRTIRDFSQRRLSLHMQFTIFPHSSRLSCYQCYLYLRSLYHFLFYSSQLLFLLRFFLPIFVIYSCLILALTLAQRFYHCISLSLTDSRALNFFFVSRTLLSFFLSLYLSRFYLVIYYKCIVNEL